MDVVVVVVVRWGCWRCWALERTRWKNFNIGVVEQNELMFSPDIRWHFIQVYNFMNVFHFKSYFSILLISLYWFHLTALKTFITLAIWLNIVVATQQRTTTKFLLWSCRAKEMMFSPDIRWYLIQIYDFMDVFHFKLQSYFSILLISL